MSTRTDLLTPVGRLVAGSLYKPNLTDAEGKPLVVKSGPNVGQPRQDYYFAVAIPKGAEQHWSQTAWGQIIYTTGRTDFPQAHLAPTFAWKVKDGDSTVPNRKGKRPCDQEGNPGHWVLSFSSGYPPGISRDGGKVPMIEVDAVNLGDYVQVFGSCGGNGSQTQSGVFLNHSKVDFVAYGKRIATGVDAAAVGFGQGIVIPAGASMTPPAGAFNPAAAAAPMGVPAGFAGISAAAAPVGLPPGFAAPAGLPGMPAGFPGAPAAGFPGVAPVAVQPHPGFLMPPAAPVAPAAPRARVMTALAGGAPYESFIAQGWTDATLVQHGYMVA